MDFDVKYYSPIANIIKKDKIRNGYMEIWAHALVKNEDRYLWFSVTSVIEYVDKLLLWDTGSTDNSHEIERLLKEKYPDKIELREVGAVDPDEFTKVRQQMLDETKSDWFLLVDGDEIWWEESIKKVVDKIKRDGKKIESIVVPTYNLVGDIYHYQEEKAGKYHLAGRTGHLNLRAVNRNIPGLASRNPHGTWGWVDSEGKMIQDRDPDRVVFVDAPYLHASFLERSTKRAEDLKVPKRGKKLKHEIGISFPKDFYFPEAFFKEKPKIIPSPWRRMDSAFYIRSLFETPLRKLKRRVIKGKSGY